MREESSAPKIDARKREAEKYGIEQFIRFASGKVELNSTILDLGAGESPYRKLFPLSEYISVDLQMGKQQRIGVIADLYHLPFRENSADAIICTQVLEHLEDPKRGLSEFYRVMKKGGKLFLTAPQGWCEHHAPHDFFRFTRYALESLLLPIGFKIVFIRPRGGFFWYLGDRLRYVPSKTKNRVIRLAISPLFWVVIPQVCFYLDRQDTVQDWTLGYACFCTK